MKVTREESDYEKSESRDSKLEDSTKKESYNTKGKQIFVYKSSDIKYLNQKYALHLLLLDASYKTSKYALPLLFTMIKMNVNFQVVGVLVFQEKTKNMI